MKIATIAGKKVVRYDSIADLPYDRFVRFNTLVMIDSEASPDLQSIVQKIAILGAMVREDKKAESLTQMNNIHQAVVFAIAGVDPAMLALAALVTEVNGSPRNDLTDEGLAATAKLYEKEKHSVLSAIFQAAKKKIYSELKTQRNEIDSQSLRYYEIIKKYIEQLKSSILNGTPEPIDFETKLLAFGTPTALHGSEAVEVLADNEHSLLKLIFSRDYHLDIDKTPVAKVLSIIRIIETQKPPAK